MKSSRKGTPDIMAGLMGGQTTTIKSESNNSVKPENNKAIKTDSKNAISSENNKTIINANNKAIKQHDNKVITNASNKTVKAVRKEKTTFNLSLHSLDNLENAWLKLRRKYKGKQRITKTLIVEKSLEIILEDLTENGDTSELIKRLQI